MMSVIKIMIDGELSKSCYSCKLSCDKYDIGRLRCIPMNKAVDNYLENRPDWCPLVVVSECEWVLHDFDGRKMYNSPENCGYHATHPEFRHCPSCGKRIKYVEVK